MVKENEKLTVKHLWEPWEKEFLPAISSEIESVKVQLQWQITTVNEWLQNIEQKKSSLSSKYDNLLEATQGANQNNTRIREVAKGLVKVARTYLYARWLCFWITFFGGNDLTAFCDFWHP